MGIEAIRFRTQDGLVVLQVMEGARRSRSAYGDIYPREYTSEEWRDAKVEDMLQVARFTSKRAVDDVAEELASLRDRYETIVCRREQSLAQAATALADEALSKERR